MVDEVLEEIWSHALAWLFVLYGRVMPQINKKCSISFLVQALRNLWGIFYVASQLKIRVHQMTLPYFLADVSPAAFLEVRTIRAAGE